MGLPWIQVDKDFARSPAAITLSHELGICRAWAVGMCVEFWTWALEHAADGRIEGPMASVVIDEVAEWRKDNKEMPSFSEAMLTAGLLEKDERGIRVIGWERYAKALKKAAKDKARKLADRERRRNGAGKSADVHRTSDGRGADVQATARGKSQSQSQTEIKKTEETICAEAPAAVVVAAFDLEVQEVGEKATPKRSKAQGFWDWAQAERRKATGLIEEQEQEPPKLNAWFKYALAKVGDSERALEIAWAKYLKRPKDPYWPERGFPFNGFMEKWREYVPAQQKEAAA